MRINLSTRVNIETPTIAQDAYGAATTTWGLLAQVWAEVFPLIPSRSESVTHGLAAARNQTRVRIRYRLGVDSSARLSIAGAGRTLQIVGGPSELGRREYLEMVCEEYTP